MHLMDSNNDIKNFQISAIRIGVLKIHFQVVVIFLIKRIKKFHENILEELFNLFLSYIVNELWVTFCTSKTFPLNFNVWYLI